MTTVDASGCLLSRGVGLSPWVWCLRLPSRPGPAGVLQQVQPTAHGGPGTHADLGQVVGRGVVGIGVIALVVVIATKTRFRSSSGWGPHGWPAAAGADSRHHCGLRGALAGTKSRFTALPSFHLFGPGVSCPRGCSRGVRVSGQSAEPPSWQSAFLGRCPA